MSLEYWLVDVESGNAQGCYLSLDDALRAAEIEAHSQPVQTLSLLGMRSPERTLQNERNPATEQHVFVRFDLGLTQEQSQPPPLDET
jgi:hypothetical protein